MSSFLDEAGVVIFWNKVKKYCSDIIEKYSSSDSSINLNLDRVQIAINKGQDVELSLPSANDGKILLPIEETSNEEIDGLFK